MQRTDGGLRLAAQWVMYADDGGKLARDAEIKMRILRRERAELLFLAFGYAAALVLKDEMRAADYGLLTLDHAGDAVRHDVLHLRMVLLMRQAAPLGLLHDRVCDGMRIVLLKAGRETQHLALFPAAEGHDLRDCRSSVGQGSGLVENYRVRCGNSLKEAPALDGNIMSAALAHRGQHRDRHGELQRTGEVHHQHSQRLCDVARDEIGQHRAAERIGHKAVGKARRLVLGGGFELFGLLYHLHDAVIAAADGCFLHADDALALFGDSARIHIAARPFRYRHGFAGHRSLIDHRLALNDLAVKRDHAAGADNDLIAGADIADGYKRLGLTGTQPRFVNVYGHRPREIGDGLLMRPLLKNLAEGEHEHDGACRREIAAEHRDGNRRRVQHRD